MSIIRPRPDVLSTYAASNLFSEPEFLQVVADVYHPGRACRIRDYVVDGQVFRLLDVEGLGPQTSQRFIDMHEPLGRAPASGPRLRSLPRLGDVALPVVSLDEFQRRPDWQHAGGAPTTLWRDFATWADYLALLRTRQHVAEDQRRGRRLAERVGALEFRVDDRAADALQTSLAWKSQRDRSLGRADMLAHAPNRRFFHELHERGLLRISTLRGGGRLLAGWLGAVHGERWIGWVFAFNPDPALTRFSLGQQLLYPMLETSFHANHSEFDFSIGMEAYKLKFATHVRPLALAGSLPVSQRAAGVARRWLAGHPALYDRARALRRRLSPDRGNAAPSASIV